MENLEDLGYRKYTSKAEAHKAFNTLCGIVEGIAMDNKINDNEINYPIPTVKDLKINE